MINSVIVEGIQFFDNASSCISHFEKSSRIHKISSFIQSIGTLFIYSLNKLSSYRTKAQVLSYTQSAVQGFSKQKLVLCLHGLNNHPAQFKQIIDKIEQHKTGTEVEIYAPCILQKGNAKLDDMAAPIFAEIEKWAQTKGKKELILIGISNGGRIARAIEALIINSGNKGNIEKIKFISIVGACQGSSLANLANKLHLSCFMSKEISKEMPTNSTRNVQLNKDSAVQSNLIRDYTFIASPHDWQVPNYDSTLMKIQNHQARYAIISGHGHNSIVNAVAKAVAKIALN